MCGHNGKVFGSIVNGNEEIGLYFVLWLPVGKRGNQAVDILMFIISSLSHSM